MRARHRTIRFLVAAFAALLAGSLALPAAASTTAPPSSTASSTAAASPFAAQASAAGLDTAQIKHLQAEVDKEITLTGGTQIAANQILQPGGRGDILIPLPGERIARELTPGDSRTADPAWHAPSHGCNYYEFCLYANTDYSGMVNRWRSCYTEPVLHYFSAYVNNQSTGTKAAFLDAAGNHLTWTKKAFGQAVTSRWWTTYFVDPC